MSGVEFEQEEDLELASRVQFVPTLAKILMRWGIVKDTKQANVALVIIAIACFLLTIYVIVNYVF